MSLLDFDSGSSECDSETELKELHQLNAVLNAEEQSPIPSTSKAHFSTASSCSSTSKDADEITKIEAGISLNKLMDEKLRKLEIILQERLQECNLKLADIKSHRGKNFVIKESNFRYSHCGKPYFRDKNNFTPPHNEDTVTIQKAGMFDFSNLNSAPGWTLKDKNQFLNLIKTMSQEIHVNEINARISQLVQDKKKHPDKIIQGNIQVLEEEIARVKKQPLKVVALPITEDYDWDYISHKFNLKHTAMEYQAFWKNYLHPCIVKKNWSKSEHLNLQKIAFANEYQDWNDIAKKLGTNRTGYQCFVYFRTNMCNTSTGKKWTNEEEEYLMRLIDYYKEGNYIPWGKVATIMDNRTKIQVYNKYFRLLEFRKGRFLPEEDAVILACMENFGIDFKKASSYLPGRSPSQIRTRYNILSKVRVSTVWTVEEDDRLIKLLASQESPTMFSNVVKFFPGKDRMNIRSRYLTLVKWMKLNPNMDISKVPRRPSRRLAHGHPAYNLSKAIESLKMRVMNEVQTQKWKRITKETPEQVIDDGIMAALSTQITKDKEAEMLQKYECEQLALPDETTVSTKNLNVTNLVKLLVFLRSQLNRTNLAKSEYCKKYSELLKVENEVSLVKVKSYSKKNPLQTIVKKIPDIFGVNRLNKINYILPPNYTTITGCRQLMTFISNSQMRSECDLNLNVLLKKNSLLNYNFTLLLERFNALFLWPMILSTRPPKFTMADEKPNQIPFSNNNGTELNTKCESVINKSDFRED